MRAAYGSADSRTNSTRPRSAKPSIRSWARAWNCGRIASMALLGTPADSLRNVDGRGLRAQQRLAPPLDERAVGHAVLGRPLGVALFEAAVLEHRRALGVAQDGPAVRGGRVPVLLPRLVHDRRSDVEGGIGKVEVRGHRGCSNCGSPKGSIAAVG